jgi:DNA helicase-2/ATP-dependent DNA helicase PcrA
MTESRANARGESKLTAKHRSELIKAILTRPVELSEDQKRAVLSGSRHTRIIAGAGAGKTETLTRRIAYLLLVDRVSPSSIVAFTFTEKAAQSMKSRIYRRVEEISGTDAIAKLGQMYIGTIHAYAKRVLEDHFRFGNYGVLDENQETAFIMRHGWSLGIQEFGKNYAESCRNFLRTVNMVFGEMLDEEELQKRTPRFYKTLKHYIEILEENKQLTFGRMIHQAVVNLRKNARALSHVRHLIVDEYQDINQAQAELIGLIGKSASIFVVGDPRQSIYQWRGSDEKFFHMFAEAFPKTEKITIRENRRSTKKIVRNANKYTDSFEQVHYEKMDPTRKEEGFIGIAEHDRPEDEARWIADQIEELVVRKKAIRFSDVGVLTRSVRTSASPLIEEFRTRGIPYVVGGKVGLFKRDEAQAVGRLFSWFYEAGFWVEDPWNWSERTTEDELLNTALEYWNRVLENEPRDDVEEKLRQIKKSLTSDKSPYDNFTKIFYDVLTALGFQRLDNGNLTDATVMANLGRFSTLLTDYETANRIGGKTPRWDRDLKGLCWFLNTYAVQAYEEQPSDDIRGIEAVQIMTIHQAKGLEWPLVFLFATTNHRFPPRRVGMEQSWCGVPRNMFDVQRYEGDIEDERRLFYVAITRARDALVFSYFRHLTRNVERSVFIEDIDGSVVTNLKVGNVPALAIHPCSESEEIQTFSTGELIAYNICPYMYLLRNIWGYQPGLVQAIGFGKALHYCLRRTGELVKNEDLKPLTAVAAAVDDGFHVPFVGGVVFQYFKNSAKNILVEFAKKYEDDLKRIEEVEYRLEYPVHNATIMGKVDVIMRAGGENEVRDYKTSDLARTTEEVSVQVRLYTIGLRDLGILVASGSIAYLEELRVKKVDITEASLDDSKEIAKKAIEGIVKGQFKPNPGEACGRCDHGLICRWKRG